ncbi:MAG: conjugal transfer protein TraF [bacterium]|nr:conjugal transfer protein TraF [bacterium]
MSNMIHTRVIVAAVLLVLAFLAADAATAGGDARSLAMGGACTASARGLDAATANPAFLAHTEGMSIGLAGGTVDLQNNSFTLARYNELSGKTLTEADKAEIMADIPVEGFGVDARADFGGVGMTQGSFAMTTSAVGAGDGRLDKDFFDLVLFGNVPGETVDFSSTDGEAFGVARASLSYGVPVGEFAGGELSVGATGSYLYGIYEVHVEEAYGRITTSMTEIEGEAFAAAITAEGGAGYGLDLGVGWRSPGGAWSLGLALDNAFATIAWDGNVERREYRIDATDLNAQTDDFDQVVVDSDTTYAVPGYSTDLPRRVRLGAAWDLPGLTLAADYVQGLENRAGTSTVPRIDLGAEWRPVGALSPRVGASLGGGLDPGLAAGLGIKVAFFQLDLAVMQRGGLGEANGKGLGAGASTRLVF